MFLCLAFWGTGQDLADVLPSAEELLEEAQLAEFSESSVFTFLLKAVYEQVASMMQAQ